MNRNQVEGNWQQLKGAVRAQWGKLTDQDVESIGGRVDQLVGALKERYGMEKEKAEGEIDRWLANVKERIAGHDAPKKN